MVIYTNTNNKTNSNNNDNRNYRNHIIYSNQPLIIELSSESDSNKQY